MLGHVVGRTVGRALRRSVSRTAFGGTTRPVPDDEMSYAMTMGQLEPMAAQAAALDRTVGPAGSALSTEPPLATVESGSAITAPRIWRPASQRSRTPSQTRTLSLAQPKQPGG